MYDESLLKHSIVELGLKPEQRLCEKLSKKLLKHSIVELGLKLGIHYAEKKADGTSKAFHCRTRIETS